MQVWFVLKTLQIQAIDAKFDSCKFSNPSLKCKYWRLKVLEFEPLSFRERLQERLLWFWRWWIITGFESISTVEGKLLGNIKSGIEIIFEVFLKTVLIILSSIVFLSHCLISKNKAVFRDSHQPCPACTVMVCVPCIMDCWILFNLGSKQIRLNTCQFHFRGRKKSKPRQDLHMLMENNESMHCPIIGTINSYARWYIVMIVALVKMLQHLWNTCILSFVISHILVLCEILKCTWWLLLITIQRIRT